MFKTIKAKTIAMQIAMMILIMGIFYVLYLTLFDDYYFNRKLRTIENAYNFLTETDISSLKYADPTLVRYRDRNLKLLITDENFVSVFADERKKPPKPEEQPSGQNAQQQDIDSAVDYTNTDARIERYIINRVDKFNNELVLKNRKNRLYGQGIITQNNQKYYVYIYETKQKMKIGFSYTRVFLLFTGAFSILAGIVVSILISNRISKPIKQIESAARKAPDNSFNVQIEEKQKFQELSSLSKSINVMLDKIRTQMQSLEEEIERKTIVEEKRRQFVNNVSHEMKTPLAIISSQVEMLELIDNEEKKAEYCQSIVEETSNMSEMLNDMIVIYSAQNENGTIELVETDLGELIKDCCEKYDGLFTQNNLTLQLDCEKDCFAQVNRRYIAQALDNYITNAVKHSPDNESVKVRVRSNDDYVRIEVENYGPHIPEEYGDKVWDMFFKGNDGETLNGQKGSGLGLYLVKSIAELHEGNYGYKNLKKGIAFWIELPKKK